MRISLTTRQMILSVLGVILLAYVLFQARFLILGPQISIESPRDAEEVYNPLLTLEGQAENVARIELNGRQIFVDEEGRWSEKLLLSPGTSIMTLTARDRFGREDEAQVRVILISNDQEQENTQSSSSPETIEGN